MSALTLTLKAPLQQRVDCSPLTPDHLAGKSAAEIAAVELHCGNRKLRVDALFDIAGDDPSEIVIKTAMASSISSVPRCRAAASLSTAMPAPISASR